MLEEQVNIKSGMQKVEMGKKEKLRIRNIKQEMWKQEEKDKRMKFKII